MLRSVTASTARASIMTVPTTPAETPMTSVSNFERMTVERIKVKSLPKSPKR